MTIAARAANIVESNADRRIGIAPLHGQIEIDDGVARDARDDEFHFVCVQVPSYRFLSLVRCSEMKLLVVEKCPCSDPSSS